MLHSSKVRKSILLIVACILILSTVGGATAAGPASPTADSSSMALFAKVVAASSDGLFVEVYEPLAAPEEVDVLYTDTEPATADQLAVTLAPDAHLALQNDDLASLPAGTPLVLGGTLSGNRFTASYIGDLTIAQQGTSGETGGAATAAAWQSGLKFGEAARAKIQSSVSTNSVDPSSTVLSFNGQFESDPWSITIPLDLSLIWPADLIFDAGSEVYIKYAVVEPFLDLYYHFPFEFTASSQEMVLSKLGNIYLNITPQAPAGGESFRTDLGMRISVFYGIMENGLETFSGEFTGFGFQNTNITGEAPPSSGETINVPATQCMDMWWIIWVLGEDPQGADKHATFAICDDIDLRGDDFHATLSAAGATADRTDLSFSLSRQQPVPVTPSSDPFQVTLNEFSYQPSLTFGLYVKTYYYEGDTLTNVTDSETLTLLRDRFPAVPLGDFLNPLDGEQPTSQTFTFSAREPYYHLRGKGTLSDGGKGASLDLLVKQLDAAGTLTGYVNYIYKVNYNKKTFKSTSIDSFKVSGNTAVVEGQATMNGKAGYNFTLTFTDDSPDVLALQIWGPNGNLIHDLAATPMRYSTIRIAAK